MITNLPGFHLTLLSIVHNFPKYFSTLLSSYPTYFRYRVFLSTKFWLFRYDFLRFLSKNLFFSWGFASNFLTTNFSSLFRPTDSFI